MNLSGRRILLGVTGGIAAYKAAELVRLLVKEGAKVRVVMTRAAQAFVTPLTFQALSQAPVATELFDLGTEANIGHIALADEAELFIIAPASADVIARLAHGLGDDLLTTVALACRAPLLLAPAMNVNMWQHPATRANLERLVARGVHTVGPDSGSLACGWVGQGRMAEPAEVAAAASALLGCGDWAGRTLLVTAGPTYEPLDPVRFLGNRSSGKMGFAVAAQAARRGAKVLLVAGPTSLPTPPGVERTDVETAAELRDATLARAGAAAAIIMSAAVADFRPATRAPAKLKKEALGDSPSLALTRNPDILAELRGRAPVVVGFAAETDEVERHAAEKLAHKGCDLIVANDVGEPGSGFGSDTNRVTLLFRSGAVERLPQLPKAEVADRLLDAVLRLLAPAASEASS